MKRTVMYVSVAILVFLFLAGSAQADPGSPGAGESRIEGVIINADTNTPPPDGMAVTILVNGWLPVYSGQGGEWNITGLGAGEYTLEIVNLPGGLNPAQPPLTVSVSGGPEEVIRVDLKYHSGPPPPLAEATPPVTITPNRVQPLGGGSSPPPATQTPPTATPTPATQLPGYGGGRFDIPRAVAGKQIKLPAGTIRLGFAIVFVSLLAAGAVAVANSRRV